MIGTDARLNGKVAWITGSGSGIGRFTALAMADLPDLQLIQSKKNL